ncbi:unnamed protein product [Heterobilharzia americana]|nr:unnamed protein product [Heterobilharzia americana]
MQTYKRLECMENKPPLHPSCDILATKQLDHVRAFLEINQRRNHLFHLSAELQKLKENVLKEDSTFQSDIEEKLHLIEVKSKIEYLERRVLELMSRVKCKKEYVSRVNSVAVIWKKIASLHDENENLLGNLPVLCSETKQYRHQVSCQLVDFHEAANEFLSSDLLQGVDDHFQTPSNDETLPSNDNFVRTLQCDSLYRRCCILFSLDPNITMPDVLLETVLNLVQNFRRAEQKLTLLSDLNDNFNRKCLDGQKIQEQTLKFREKLQGV